MAAQFLPQSPLNLPNRPCTRANSLRIQANQRSSVQWEDSGALIAVRAVERKDQKQEGIAVGVQQERGASSLACRGSASMLGAEWLGRSSLWQSCYPGEDGGAGRRVAFAFLKGPGSLYLQHIRVRLHPGHLALRACVMRQVRVIDDTDTLTFSVSPSLPLQHLDTELG